MSRQSHPCERACDSDILELGNGQIWLNLRSAYDIRVALSVEEGNLRGLLGDSAWAVGRACDYIW